MFGQQHLPKVLGLRMYACMQHLIERKVAPTWNQKQINY